MGNAPTRIPPNPSGSSSAAPSPSQIPMILLHPNISRCQDPPDPPGLCTRSFDRSPNPFPMIFIFILGGSSAPPAALRGWKRWIYDSLGMIYARQSPPSALPAPRVLKVLRFASRQAPKIREKQKKNPKKRKKKKIFSLLAEPSEAVINPPHNQGNSHPAEFSSDPAEPGKSCFIRKTRRRQPFCPGASGKGRKFRWIWDLGIRCRFGGAELLFLNVGPPISLDLPPKIPPEPVREPGFNEGVSPVPTRQKFPLFRGFPRLPSDISAK